MYQTAKIWDLETEKELISFDHLESVFFCSFSPDGKMIITRTSDDILRIWDVKTGNETTKIVPNELINNFNFSPDGKTIVTSSDKSAKIWSVETGMELISFFHPESVFSCGFSPDGRMVITGTSDGILRIWDLKTGEELKKYLPAYLCENNFLMGDKILAKDKDCNIIILKMMGFSFEFTISTPKRLYLHKNNKWDKNVIADCYWCDNQFIVLDEIVNNIIKIEREFKKKNRWIFDAWDDPRLISECPVCSKKIKFNPFIVDNA